MATRWAGFLKAAGILCAAAAAAAGIAAVALKIYFPPKKLRALVVDQARKSLRREVRLKGVSLGIFRGLTLKGIEVSESPDFRAGVFAAADSFRLSVRWRPLLSKRVEIGAVSLDGLRLRIARAKDGKFNFSDLAAAPSPAPAAPGGGGAAAAPSAVRVDRAAVSRGSIEFRDESTAREVSLTGVELALRDFSLNGPFGLDLALAGRESGRGERREGSLDLSGTFDLARSSAKLKRLSLKTRGYTLKLSGDVRGPEDVAADVKASLADAEGELASAEIKGTAARRGAPPYDARLEVQARTRRLAAARLKPAALPEGLVLPALQLESSFKVSGQDVRLDSLRVRTEGVDVKASGSVAHAFGAKPAADLAFSCALDLPELTSDEFAWAPGAPKGLRIPAFKLDAAGSVGLDALRLSSARLRMGGNDLELSGALTALRSAVPRADLILKGKSFVLDELAKIHPASRGMGVTGRGFFALAASGQAKRPYLAGKVRFEGLGGEVAGLKLSGYSATVSCDDKRIEIPNLRGKLGDGELALDVTIKDYVRAPQVEIDGSLTSLDLGKLLAARAATDSKASPAPAARPAPAGPKAPPVSTRGKFSIGEWNYMGTAARDTRLSWDLSGITPELTALNGAAKLEVGQGRLRDLGAMASQSKVAKILLSPFMVIQKIGRIGGLQVFPDFNNVAFDSIVGDYAFAKGVMTLRECRLGGSDATASSTGSIDLPAERLDLLVTAQVGRLPPVDVEIKGTFEDPKSKPKLLKAIAEPARRALEEGGRKLLEGIFK